jgi:hypothetical protein
VPQKESDSGQVHVEPETQYSIRLRNKNSWRCCAQIRIDGENVSGGGYIIEANSYVDIHRFNNTDKAFRFVLKDSPDAVDHGKNHVADYKCGVINVTFYREKEQSTYLPTVPVEPYEPIKWPKPRPWRKPDPWVNPNPYFLNSSGPSKGSSIGSSYMSCSVGPEEKTSGFTPRSYQSETGLRYETTDPGVTVEGNKTGQSFYTVSFYIDYSTAVTVTLKLVTKAVSVRETITYCPRCSSKPRPKAKFCHNCGLKF